MLPSDPNQAPVSASENDEEKIYVNAAQMMELVAQNYTQGKLIDTEKLCLKLLAWNEEHAPAWFFRGLVAQAEGRHDEALDFLQKSSAAPDLIVPRLIAEGRSLIAQGATDDAIHRMRQALDFQPDNAEAQYWIGFGLKMKNELTEARSYLRRATLLNPEFAPAWYELGNVTLMDNRFDEAVRAFEKAAKLMPDAAEIPNNLALAHQAAGHLDAAETAFRRALELSPDYPEAMANLGLLLRSQERLDESKALLDRALSLRPELREVLPD
ncbi:tetratricopeptide repeat protein [Chitinimonas lacunae]|uniref:Tetratricopeptide repeat protein n=1 Tax=Chitinimonas lacunae TaxID=1963018 RepID=A0ABV8MTH4_9NEIS